MNLHEIINTHSRTKDNSLKEIISYLEAAHRRAMPSEIKPYLDIVHTAMVLAYAGNYQSVLREERYYLLNEITCEARDAMNAMLKSGPHNAKLVIASIRTQQIF